jgi:hypothetical protein
MKLVENLKEIECELDLQQFLVRKDVRKLMSLRRNMLVFPQSSKM